MNNYSLKNSDIDSLLKYYSTLRFQNTFLDYGICILSDYNQQKLHESIVTLDELKEDLSRNPENKILKIKFNLKLSQLKSVILTQKRIEVLTNDIKKLKSR